VGLTEKVPTYLFWEVTPIGTKPKIHICIGTVMGVSTYTSKCDVTKFKTALIENSEDENHAK